MRNLLFLLLCCLFTFHISAQKQIWGTVYQSTEYPYGFIFKTDTEGNNLEVVHVFNSTEGRFPGAIMQASNGRLYGCTERGGKGEITEFHRGGVLYEYDPATDRFRVLVHFSEKNTDFPYDGPKFMHKLTEVSPGILYGSLAFGGLQFGHIFSYNISTEKIQRIASLPSFQGGAGNTTQGNRLNGPMFPAPDGYLYATTERYSQCPVAQPERGTIVRINPSNGNISYAYVNPCSGDDGYYYYSHFIEKNGSLYSVAPLGGSEDKGVIYRFTPATNTLTKKYDFKGGPAGQRPMKMVESGNGRFYGIAEGGAPEPNVPLGSGILFEYDPVTEVFTKKIDFAYENGWIFNVGPYPLDLTQTAGSEKIFGVTSYGVFEYDILTNTTQARGRFGIVAGVGIGISLLAQICKFPAYEPLTSKDYTLCAGSTFSLDLESDNTSAVVWKHNGIVDPTQTTTRLTLNKVKAGDEGSWVAELTNECGTTVTEPVYIHLNQPIIISQSGDTLRTAPTGISYQWINCDNGTPVTGATEPDFVPSQNGSFAIVITYPDQCSDTSDCFTITTISVEESSFRNRITIYPNPVTDILHLAGDARMESATIRNIYGQTLLYQKHPADLDVSGLAQGVYFIAVQTDRGIWKDKFIKE